MGPLPAWVAKAHTEASLRSLAIRRARDEAFEIVRRSLAERAANATAPDPTFQGGSGSEPATAFNNKAILALFATLGAAMVLASLWFFFWAKNGGFHFQEGDWDDYKSTVLRRKGPDGRTLTNATKSTKLGGSTIVGTQHFRWAKHAAKSVVSYDEKGRKGIMGKRGWGKTHSVMYSDDFTDFGDGKDSRTISDEMTEVRSVAAPRDHHHHHHREHEADHHRHSSKPHRDRELHEYKKEKPARVGGINRIPDGSHVDTTNSEMSDIHSEHSEQPILHKHRGSKDQEQAERRARAEAAKMERRWKREAEEAAATLAQESSRSAPPPTAAQPKKSATPSKPSGAHHRNASRSASPKKRGERDFSYQTGPESEVLSTSQTGTTSRRTTSYYDAYRPHAGEQSQSQSGSGYTSDYTASRSSRQGSPAKKPAGRSGGAYRRGADSDLD